MKVYIEDLNCYNNGFSCVVGKWVEMPCENLSEVVKGILTEGTKLCGSVSEEIFLTDWEDTVVNVNEYSDVFKLNEIAEQLSTLDDHEKKIVEFLLGDNIVKDLDEAISHIEDVIIYESMTMEDIAEQYIEDCVDLSNVPDIIKNHIDYEAIARDMYIDGNYYKVDGDIYEVNI